MPSRKTRVLEIPLERSTSPPDACAEDQRVEKEERQIQDWFELACQRQDDELSGHAGKNLACCDQANRHGLQGRADRA